MVEHPRVFGLPSASLGFPQLLPGIGENRAPQDRSFGKNTSLPSLSLGFVSREEQKIIRGGKSENTGPQCGPKNRRGGCTTTLTGG